eukprot:CAMPEP_0179182618 /NCGR_PEP_ID=MMETSP0796-20121207/90489_1 /TAXON_ID=73915 /ORGANISM="Pyrodinium bahamense, Strain pbaha01" /LENGTH=184 /DNA_ID=CAMNT_0020886467 /DNA_START=3 /DNA_END=557 /DNA_ORIENTATION=-
MGGGASVNIGPIQISEDEGFQLKPKFDFGYQDDHFQLNAGLGDVRNGINFSANAGVGQTFHAEGSSLREFLRNVEAEGASAQVIGKLVNLIPRILSEVMRLTRVDVEFGHVEGSVEIQFGVGFEGGVALGWKNEDGFYMVGGSLIGGEFGGKLYVGEHDELRRIKIICAVDVACYVELDVTIDY